MLTCQIIILMSSLDFLDRLRGRHGSSFWWLDLQADHSHFLGVTPIKRFHGFSASGGRRIVD